MITPDPIRAALERLVEAEGDLVVPYDECGPAWHELLAFARAALAAAPEGKGPSESDVANLFYRHIGEGSEVGFENAIAEALARWGRPATPPAPAVGEPSQEPVDLPPDYIDEWITNPRDRSLLEVFHKACISEGGSADEVILRGLKAVLHDDLSRSHRLQQENHRFREPERTILCDILANGTLLPDPDGTRYGIPPAPLEGEVGELPPRPPIKSPPEHPWLVRYGVTWQGGRNKPLLTPRHDGYWTPWFVAATLLQRLPAPAPAVVPVAVIERPWERPGWCDAQGRCWAEHISRCGTASWRLARIDDLGGWSSRLLPAHALPLPAPQGGEAQP